MPRLVAFVSAGAPYEDALAQTAAEDLTGWDLCMTADSTAAATALLTLIFLREQPGVSLRASGLVGGTFTEGDVATAFGSAVEHLRAHFGAGLATLGDLTRLRRGDLDLALGGGPDVLAATYGVLDEDGRVRANNGDGHIMLVTWDAEGRVSSRSIHQYGSAHAGRRLAPLQRPVAAFRAL